MQKYNISLPYNTKPKETIKDKRNQNLAIGSKPQNYVNLAILGDQV